ncbi:hypothetical protein PAPPERLAPAPP_03760 [Brevundimonas phage vB_BpoS-Papperlapapp]|uniref:Uncharacterized protein n=1 Tax=Brevundimonas phage vB_BpoS-Kabachok TaxID=2948600 RepID=A0A9E7SJP7_9CAUD|nr:hypothetical protein KABACHOK_02140 [Brevundimonas phage vB_BpoS-Kabachok]USN16117.1 hypothetical protein PAPPERLAPAPP_03760 [Brevundimonas phage vB_BpoS-Papperlapapp]
MKARLNRWMKRWRERHNLPPRPCPTPNAHPWLMAQEARRVAAELRRRPNEPTTMHAHTLADVYEMIAHLNERVAALEDAGAVRAVGQAYERTLPR